MDEDRGSTQTSREAAPPTVTVRCDQCGEEVPGGVFCVRCGDPLGPELRRGRSGRVREVFAAAPRERVLAPRIVSTLFPALPRAHMRTFRLGLAAGVAAVAALALVGLYPLAIVAAAVLVPLLAVLYVYDVDVYEDEPLRVVALTLVWGATAGAIFALLVERLLPTDVASTSIASIAGDSGGGDGLPLARGVVVPLLGGLLMALGPLALLAQRRFNDVLDGATFGVASAVAFTGAQSLVTAAGFFDAGLRPTGDPLPWLARLASLSVIQPLVAAGAVGGFLGVVWLRYRSPVRDRATLGPLGMPPVAALVGAALLVAQALALELLDVGWALLVLVPLTVVALLWLRRILHLGLLQEAREIPVGPPAPCPDCGRPTAWHSYCGECGVAFAALPKRRPARTDREADVFPAPRAAEKPRLPGVALVLLFSVVFLFTLVIAAGTVAFLSRDLDRPDCPDPDLPCAGAVRGSTTLRTASLLPPAPGPEGSAPGQEGTLPFFDWTTYQDDSTGFSLQYDPTLWTVDETDAGYLLLILGEGAAALVVDAVPADQHDAESILRLRRDLWKESLLALARDDDPARVLVGTPILGHRPGEGRLFGATLDSAMGPATPVALALVSASDGTITAVASVLTDASVREPVFEAADSVLGTFTWPNDAPLAGLVPAGGRVASTDPGRPPDGAASDPAAGPAARLPVSPPIVLGPADPAETVLLGLSLRGRDPAGLERFLRDLHDPAAPGYRGYLTPDEFGRRFGLDPGAETRLRDRLSDAGLDVVSLGPQRTTMRVRGRVDAVGRLLGVGIERLASTDGSRFLAADREPVVPAALREAVTGVTGLGRSLPVSLQASAVPALPSRGLRPVDLARAYGLEDLYAQGLRGEGTSVAILQFGRDTDEDLAVFDAAFDIEGPLPERIAVDTGLGNVPVDFGQEATLDTQVVRAVAPEAQILVYEIPPELGISGGIEAIVADGRAQVISLSYGFCDVPGEYIPRSERIAGRQALAAAVAAGMTLFAASGDWGAFTCQAFDTTDLQEATLWPSCNTDVVSVGGTYLEVWADGSYARETGWQDYLSTAGTGGGVNPTDAAASWQAAPGLDVDAFDGRRPCPDVAGPADSDTGYLIYYTDPETGASDWWMVGGTSGAAPFWAGAMALVQQAAAAEGIDRLGFLGPTLYRVAAEHPEAFHDVTRGGNLKAPATPGWDQATGLGSPDMPVLTEAILEVLR